MGLIAHPGNIASIACSGDGKHFFTCGGEDKTINIWSINKGAISDNFAQKYEDNDPFLNLLEGGRNG
jgi:WD40 repeat protein